MAQTSVCYEVYFCIDASTLLNSYSAWYLYARIQWNQHTSMYIFNDTSTPLCTYSLMPAHLKVYIQWCQHTSKFIFSDTSTPLCTYSVIPAYFYFLFLHNRVSTMLNALHHTVTFQTLYLDLWSALATSMLTSINSNNYGDSRMDWWR